MSKRVFGRAIGEGVVAARGLAVLCGVCLLAAGEVLGQGTGTIDRASEAWYTEGTELTVTATPAPYRFVEWRGDTNAAVVAAETLSFTVEGPREIDVVFKDHVTETTGVPWWWLAEQDPEREWTPEDFEAAATAPAASGVPLWEAYVTGMDPQSTNAVFAIARVAFEGGLPQLKWSHDRVPPHPIIIQFRTNLLHGAWQVVGSVSAVDGENTYASSEEQQGYYRLVVETP